ncbi:MAG TPA: rhomboid family intramembrane serine protease [Terriglobales bacterium]|nr:rhomboid family intramembrane serine protease [Terriglobales bacterium]
MLIPIRHENMSARRWPVITFALIAINMVVFLGTFQNLEQQQKQIGQLKLRILMLAVTHPELNLSSDAQEIVDTVKRQVPAEWERLAKTHAVTRIPATEDLEHENTQEEPQQDTQALQSEMDSLSAQLQQARVNSIADKYAFVPAHPTAVSYLTANFLHGGWLHLIGNMWFLWLAGFVLEDFWGRYLYTAFYLIAGVAALQFHAWLNTGSIVPTLGASGAVAALMGAFLVRFPKMKIEMLWWAIARFRFKAAAYWLLPAWLFMELFYGSLGQATGVAHWAHVGGFVFGALAALGLRYSGLEQKANQKIEQELTLQSDPEIQQASDMIDKGQLDMAETVLNGYLARKPSADACNLLLHVHQQRQDHAARSEVLAKLCEVHAKAGEHELAWSSYEEFLNAGSKNLSPAAWIEICRVAEKLQRYDRCLTEYEKLLNAYPADRQSIVAQIGAARLCLKKLNRPEKALEFFQAAERSPVPHLDWEQSITAGIREAKAALGQTARSAAASSGQD